MYITNVRIEANNIVAYLTFVFAAVFLAFGLKRGIFWTPLPCVLHVLVAAKVDVRAWTEK